MQSLIFKSIISFFKWITSLCSLFVFSQNIISEKWEGNLMLNQNSKLRVAFEINRNIGKFHSIDQKSFNIPTDSLIITNDERFFVINSLNTVFKGKILDNILCGKLIIGKLPFDVSFKKCNEFSFYIPKRPQEETLGGNYSTEDYSIITTNNGNRLAGVLTIPHKKVDFPTVVFISGSGPNDRDHSIFGHKNFLVLADLFAKAGIATLRLDDRGVGESTGNFETATIYDLGNDVADAVNKLTKDKRINPNKIGILGHSLGAEIAPRVSAINPNVQFVIMMAGSADPLFQCIIDQTEKIYASEVKSVKSVDVNTKILKALFKAIELNQSNEQAKQAFNQSLEALRSEIKSLPAEDLNYLELKPDINANDFEAFFGMKMRTDLFYQPTEWLSKVRVPILAINGSLDTQVLPKNLDIIKKTLENQNHKNFVVKLYEGKNHMFQNAKTGLPNEYADIEETIATDVVFDIINWINKNFK